jgi:hypothetical protein
MNGGLVIYATEAAKEKYEGKLTEKKNKKTNCPSCDINELKKKRKKDNIKDNNEGDII